MLIVRSGMQGEEGKGMKKEKKVWMTVEMRPEDANKRQIKDAKEGER
jgi:hypothetical protein